jgi:pilus assembly protein CpaB
MQARTLKIIAALLIVSAIIMGVIGYRISMEDKAREQQRSVATQTSGASDFTYAQKIVIANRDLPKGSQLKAEDLSLIPYPIVVETGFTKLNDVVGKELEMTVLKGSVLRQSDFEELSPLTSQIPVGFRAVAVKVDEVVGTGGFLTPGDYVDVIFSSRAGKETQNKSLARRVLRNVQLLAFGSDLKGEQEELITTDEKGKPRASTKDKDTGKRSKSAVLSVSLEEVNKLILAEEAGDLRLVAVGEMELSQADGDANIDESEELTEEDLATFMRAVTGFKPAPPPKSVYVYSGDKVETIRVPK